MNTEEILDIVKDFTNHIRFNEKAKYSVSQWYMAIEDLLELYIDKNTELQKEKEKNKNAINYIKRLEINSIGTPFSYTFPGKELIKILQGEKGEKE